MSQNRWRVTDLFTAAAEENMQRDALWLKELKMADQPLLHLYRWSGPAITYGHFCQIDNLLKRELLIDEGWQLARRPTGGGATFHLGDLAFSLLVPAQHPAYSYATHQRYLFVNSAIAEAVQRCCGQKLSLSPSQERDKRLPHFCMAAPTPFDLVVNGRKIGGAAQRVTQEGFLHQGYLSLLPLPIERLKRYLHRPEDVLPLFSGNNTSLLGDDADGEQIEELRQAIEMQIFATLQRKSQGLY